MNFLYFLISLYARSCSVKWLPSLTAPTYPTSPVMWTTPSPVKSPAPGCLPASAQNILGSVSPRRVGRGRGRTAAAAGSQCVARSPFVHFGLDMGPVQYLHDLGV